MQLHTSLAELKGALTGIPPAAMTALPAQVRALVDPAFTNGLGSLLEDPVRGLRCPLRACGSYHHSLGVHLRRAHPTVDPIALRRVLEIPRTAALISTATRQRMQRGAADRARAQPRVLHPTTADRARGIATKTETAATMGARNLHQRCDAQLREKLQALVAQLSHTPTVKEAELAWGAGLVSYIVRHYVTWNDFKRRAGIPTLARGGQTTITLDAVVEALSAWATAHQGELPTYDEAARPDRTPPLPHPSTVLRVMCTTSWDWAMRRVAAILGLRDGRYGIRTAPMVLLRRCETCTQLTRKDPCDHCGAAYAGVRTAVA